MKNVVLSLLLITLLISLSASCYDKNSAKKKKETVDNVSSVAIFSEQRSAPIQGAKVNITFPESQAVITDGDISLGLAVNNFELGVQTSSPRANELSNSVDGQHIHLIVDNKPYKAIYDISSPVNIGKLDPGPHTVLVFPSRSYHESVKGVDAYDLVNFYVVDKDMPFVVNGAEPAVFYSRPKGEYKGVAAKKIMLDFYLLNIQLSNEGFKAKYTVTKKGSDSKETENYSIILSEWIPAFITNLSTGTYEVKLQIIDKNGQAVSNVAYNGTTRTINVITEE